MWHTKCVTNDTPKLNSYRSGITHFLNAWFMATCTKNLHQILQFFPVKDKAKYHLCRIYIYRYTYFIFKYFPHFIITHNRPLSSVWFRGTNDSLFLDSYQNKVDESNTELVTGITKTGHWAIEVTRYYTPWTSVIRLISVIIKIIID